jgi:glycosyltransferase involved in cell wall biosynthesis
MATPRDNQTAAISPRWVTDVVHVGTDIRTRGGIASVISAIKNETPAECFAHIVTHCDGSAGRKAAVFVGAVLRLLVSLVRRRDRLYHLHISTNGSFVRKSLCILLIGAFSKPVVAHMHGSGFASFYDEAIGPVGRWLFRAVLERATVIIALSPEWNRFFQRMVPADRVVTLENAVPVSPLAAPRKVESRGVSILSLGRLGERKGTYDLVAAFAALTAPDDGAMLDLAGDGDITQVKDLIERQGLSGRIRVHGWVDRDGCGHLLSRCDVFVLPSYAEGLPMALLEAMSHGVPVVSTPVGGISSLIEHGVNGLLVEPGNVAAIAAAIGWLADHPADRARIGAAGRDTIVARYSIRPYVHALNDIYRRVLGE